MKQWMFDSRELKLTPSRKDGIDKETEDRYRREGVRMIMDIGTAIGLTPYPSLATAAVYFHRFYMFHSFKEFSRYLTALGSLFLAGKVEETPKKCRDIIETAKKTMNEQQFLTLSKNPMEEIMSIERVLLQTAKFDLQVDHPYRYLLHYAKCLKLEKTKVEKVVQMAWTFVNDSLSTTLCLQWEPEIIAIALMYLATRLSKVEVLDWTGRRKQQQQGTSGNTAGGQWWDQYVENLTKDIMEDICHQLLDLYGKQQAGGVVGASSVASSAVLGVSSASIPASTHAQTGNSRRASAQATAGGGKHQATSAVSVSSTSMASAAPVMSMGQQGAGNAPAARTCPATTSTPPMFAPHMNANTNGGLLLAPSSSTTQPPPPQQPMPPGGGPVRTPMQMTPGGLPPPTPGHYHPYHPPPQHHHMHQQPPPAMHYQPTAGAMPPSVAAVGSPMVVPPPPMHSNTPPGMQPQGGYWYGGPPPPAPYPPQYAPPPPGMPQDSSQQQYMYQ